MDDKRGLQSVTTREANRLRVWNFFHNNPFKSRQECAQELDLSVIVIGRHIKAIKDGWVPDGRI